MENVLDIVFRSASVYVFMIIAIRIFGKKELAQLSIIDLVLILLISNAVQNAMVGNNTSLESGLIAAITLFVLNFLLKKLMYYYKPFGRFVQGSSTLLVYKGKINYENLQQVELTVEELQTAIREHGVDSVAHVDLAMLEVDGNISVLSDDFQKRSFKKRRVHKTLKEQE